MYSTYKIHNKRNYRNQVLSKWLYIDHEKSVRCEASNNEEGKLFHQLATLDLKSTVQN